MFSLDFLSIDDGIVVVVGIVDEEKRMKIELTLFDAFLLHSPMIPASPSCRITILVNLLISSTIWTF